MNLLIIGYSSLVARRVLPAALKIQKLKKIIICTKKKIQIESEWTKAKEIVFYDHYEVDLPSQDTFVYISTPNSLHSYFAKYYLNRGFHVIIDKPAVMNSAEAKELSELALKNRSLLAEANVWYRHPLAKAFKEKLDASSKNHNLRIFQFFTNPPLDKDNFRYDTDYGGGILYDRASYTISLSRFLLSEYPDEIDVHINERNEKGLDLSSEIFFRYKDRSILLSSYFSLNAQYLNRLQLLGENISLETERIFTPPDNYYGKILSSSQGKNETIDVPTGDSFQLFLEEVLDSVAGDGYDKYANELYSDSIILDKIINFNK
ncbi:hypothetical protein LPTSP3_g21190 [Leptospira kobayashii]|uniref:Oxidoreductase, NAD-binding domain protein n=1 Tax=Leptospira kobayashii TaxID=1917830 RepID=A0ABM7UJY1_9LEPT|nr:Gfo/Idh/MocA family oxidoreductase [Leptospira kobayashii]BDA79189.1 hypothetical protein LPTSP3_g21190 [Leptospira kobayashii]